MKINYFILLIIAIFLFVSCKSDSTISLEHFDKAKLHASKKDYPNALAELDTAHLLDEHNKEILLLQSDIKFSMRSYSEAINLYEEILPYKEDVINYLLAQCYFELYFEKSRQDGNDGEIEENLSKAILYCDKCLLKNPLDYNSLRLKGKALHNSGKYKESISLYNLAILSFPDSLDLILNM